MKLTNLKIEQLNEQRAQNRAVGFEFEKALQKEYDKLFDDSKTLQDDIKYADNASMYMAKDDGIYSWFKVRSDLSMFEEHPDLKPYLEAYLADHSLGIDWINDCFENYQGDDNYIIQDDTRSDNGVWQSGKCIIEEQEYKDADGEVDEERRNELIEAHMTASGYFPGVFRVTQHGDVYLVNTTKNKVGAS